VKERIDRGFDDVDSFTQFALSILNRRKSRAGAALENHMEYILQVREILYERAPVTENRSRPDFLFPGIQEYHDESFPAALLTMLGVKTSCKDRWRQVLSEALLTLEPGISVNQTDEMRANGLRLVVPINLHDTYVSHQREWLMDVSGFMTMVSERQRSHLTESR